MKGSELVGRQDADKGCGYLLFLGRGIMDSLHDITGVELRQRKVKEQTKAKEEGERQKARKAAGKAAEEREKAAGLPPAPGSEQGSTRATSGDEFEGPGDKFGSRGPCRPR